MPYLPSLRDYFRSKRCIALSLVISLIFLAFQEWLRYFGLLDLEGLYRLPSLELIMRDKNSFAPHQILELAVRAFPSG
jgi:hypothetical protein